MKQSDIKRLERVQKNYEKIVEVLGGIIESGNLWGEPIPNQVVNQLFDSAVMDKNFLEYKIKLFKEEYV